MNNGKGVKVVLTIIPLVYIIGIAAVPFLQPLATNWIAWGVLFIYLLNLGFFWAIGGKKKLSVNDREEATKDTKVSQELLKDRNKWGGF